MAVEVTAHDDWCMRVLLDDVFGDVHDYFRTVLQFLLLSWLDVAVEHLNDVLANLQLSPAEMCPQGLHQ